MPGRANRFSRISSRGRGCIFFSEEAFSMKRIPVSAAILLALALTQAAPSSAAPDDGSAMKEAVTAYNIGQYKRTYDIVKPLADKGNTRAAVLLGRLYENGLGVDPDPVTAAEWYRKAAEAGSVEGMKLLSFASRTGYGAVKSNAEAFNWMQRAADAGDAEAQYNLALMLNEGKIVDANPKLAFAWALQSAKKGFGEAELFVGACYEGGIGTEKNAAEAEKWYAKAARQGFTARGSVFSRTTAGGAPASGAEQNQPAPAGDARSAEASAEASGSGSLPVAPSGTAPAQPQGSDTGAQGGNYGMETPAPLVPATQEGSYGLQTKQPARPAPADPSAPNPVPLTGDQAR